MFRNLLAMGVAALLAGCVGGSGPVSAPSGGGVARANSVIAEEFISYMFATEGGVRIPRLLKYEGPVRVSLDGALGAYRGDLQRILAGMRQQSGIDIALTDGAAHIRILRVPAAPLKQIYPTAACVVVPGVSSFAEVQRRQFPRWSRQTALSRAVVLIPDNAPPYIVRACFNEEIAQALGPVNDLYRVSDTVLNDDNVFNRLTTYDHLILHLLYSPELQSGMGQAAVRAQLPALLARINPAGQRGGNGTRSDPRWKTLIETAMNGANPRPARLSAAQKAVERARRLGGHRLAHSLVIYGRLNLQAQPALAAPAFQEAYQLNLTQLGPHNLRTALAAMHVAAVAIKAGEFDAVITLTTPALATAKRFNDPILQAGIQGLRALAFARLGQNSAAQAARVDSLAQARYAFGNNAAQIAASQAQIEGLLPENN
ncbi:MAG: DUF2927 domain-containing protein [Rhodobacteraceae bacterium]|nr:DUF2927 domain-containing protein [Paracoccaceae bacterium]